MSINAKADAFKVRQKAVGCRQHGAWTGPQKQCPECARINNARWCAALKTETIQHYGGECACCGEAREVFLTINRDGAAHRRELAGDRPRRTMGGRLTYSWLRQNGWPAGFRVLCFNCQFATFRGVCPHQESADA